MIWLILLVLSFLFGSCGAPIPVYFPLPVDACPLACGNLHTLQCPQAEDLEACIAFCESTMQGGYDLNLGCAVSATSCVDFDACQDSTETPR